MAFDTIFDSIGPSLLGYKKSLNLYNELCQVKHIAGNTAEIGVYQGVTSKLIHMCMSDRTHYAYDTYAGIQGADSKIDFHKDGEFSCSLNLVKARIRMDGVVYKVGYFPKTFTESSERFVFVHSDTDTYMGTKATLQHFAPIINQGGKLVFDDYQWKHCPGVEKAISEFLNTNNDFIVKVYDNSYSHPKDDGSINQCVLTRK